MNGHRMNLEPIEKIFRLFNYIFVVACAGALIALVSIITAEIVLRSFLDISLSWIHETNIFLASWLYFLGIGIVYHNGRDITINLIVEKFPKVLGRVAAHLYPLLTAIVFLLLAYHSWRLIELQSPFQTPGVGFPRYIYTLPLFISSSVIGLQSLYWSIAPSRMNAELPTNMPEI